MTIILLILLRGLFCLGLVMTDSVITMYHRECKDLAAGAADYSQKWDDTDDRRGRQIIHKSGTIRMIAGGRQIIHKSETIRMKKYLYVVKTQIIKSMTYEFNVYGNILMQTIIMITSAHFWRALYQGRGMVGDVDADSMLTYVVVSSLLSVLLITNVERRIQMSVIKGTVATDMMKPINIFGVYFAEDIGNIAALTFQNMLPILVIGSLLIKVPGMADIRDMPLFILSVAESFLINWLIAALFGMIAFTAVNIDALIQVKKHLLRLLSGSIIPIWFFPAGVARILEALPFVYIYLLKFFLRFQFRKNF